MATLEFKGKALVQNYHLTVKYHQLVPKKDKSLTDKVRLDDNLIIHGDNLKALKALLPTYAGKVKCIYIDPPYNTGNEGWAYNDNVNSPMMQEWLGKAVDREDLTRHDKWLSMMMPRLKLLKELLREDGVIFISADDNEVHRLWAMMDETFGEENFVGLFVVNSSPSAIDYGHIAKMHDYVLFYAKDTISTTTVPLVEKDKEFKYKDKTGPFNIYPLYNGNVAFNPKTRPNLYYPFYLNPSGKLTEDFYEIGLEHRAGWVQVFPVVSRKDGIQRVWRWGKTLSSQHLNEEIVGYKTEDGEFRVVQKTRHTGKVIRSLQIDKDISTRRGTAEVEELFGKKVFPFPKSMELIRRLVAVSTEKDSVVLDSFAGSGTTAHAVVVLNKEDGGNRKFILVECEDYADSITAERVRRVIKGVRGASDEDLQKGLGGTFSYFELGKPIELESILDGKNLPSYLELARYVFYTATGEEFDERKVNEKRQFVGASKNHEVYLFYKPDIDYLKKTALTLKRAEEFGKPKVNGKRRLVFAPTKYLDQEQLDAFRIDFAQLPFEIYKLAR